MQDSNCKTCKKTPISNYENKLAIFGIYLVLTSVYGTYKLLEIIYSLF